MKAMILALCVFVSSASAFAGEPKATVFSELAQKTVQTMFGRQGDVVSAKLTQMDHGEVMKETWEVSLTNGANIGSAIYEVEITQNTAGTEPDTEVASVKVKYLIGN